jgi:hypothetical protein
MARSHDLEVHLERQPHRDAVQRLRSAYRQLRLSGPASPKSVEPGPEEQPRSLAGVQEVQ